MTKKFEVETIKENNKSRFKVEKVEEINITRNDKHISKEETKTNYRKNWKLHSQMTLEERFWEKVDKRGEDECWEWKAGRNKEGYGIIGGNYPSAHRLSWLIHHNNIPEGTEIMHTCNNPSCVNPKHLKAGTHKDNMKQMTLEGRHSIKLNWNIVNKIRQEYIDNKHVTMKEIAKKHNISAATVSFIVLNKQWKDDNYKLTYSRPQNGENTRTAKLTWDKIKEIRECYFEHKISFEELGRKFGISGNAIGNVIKNKTWHDSDYQKLIEHGYKKAFIDNYKKLQRKHDNN